MLKSGVAKIYEWGHRAHMGLYETGLFTSIKLPIKTLSVGNLTMGGTGKTPVVMKIAQVLSERFKVAILSRGYKASASSTGGFVRDENRFFLDVKDAGDEPFMMASQLNKVPIFVGKKRWKSALWAAHAFQPQLFILDDGFQHQCIYSDVHVVVLDGDDPFGKMSYFPKGRLRDHPRELKRAHCIVFLHSSPVLKHEKESIFQEILEWNPEVPIYEAYFRPVALIRNDGQEEPLETLKDKKVFAFCGIGKPQKFLQSLKTCGAHVVSSKFFPDHHQYSLKQLEYVGRLAQKNSAQILVTTEKDAVRLPKQCFSFYYLKVDVQFLAREKEFFQMLATYLPMPSDLKSSC